MRLAEARLAASSMIACSMIASLTGAAWLCRMNTSAPRMDSPKVARSSEFGKSTRLGSPRVTPSPSATAWASSGWDRPAYSCSCFLVTSSIRASLLALAGEERPGHRSGGDPAAGGEAGEGTHPGTRTDLRETPNSLLDHRALVDDAVDEPRVGSDLGAGFDDRVALEDRAGEEGDVDAELDAGGDVGALGVEHGDALEPPAVVGAGAERGLGDGELGTVVDAGRLHRVGDDHADDVVPGVVEDGDDVGQ